MLKIGTINKTKQILEKYGLYAVKNFGQNFIVDQNTLLSIAEVSGVNKDINVIEIGPGIGSLTDVLLDKAHKVLAYEIDKKLIGVLEDLFYEYYNFALINEDILKADIKKDIEEHLGYKKDIYIISNLPYYITTPIIMKLLELKLPVKKMVFMMQKEVADRIVANKGGKDYNNLSIAVKYYADAKKVLNVSRNIFIPKPNVDSAVVLLEPRADKYQVEDEQVFFKLVRNAFKARRKTLVNNLRDEYDITKEKLEQMLKDLNININARAEELSIEEFILLYRKMAQ